MKDCLSFEHIAFWPAFSSRVHFSFLQPQGKEVKLRSSLFPLLPLTIIPFLPVKIFPPLKHLPSGHNTLSSHLLRLKSLIHSLLLLYSDHSRWLQCFNFLNLPHLQRSYSPSSLPLCHYQKLYYIWNFNFEPSSCPAYLLKYLLGQCSTVHKSSPSLPLNLDLTVSHDPPVYISHDPTSIPDRSYYRSTLCLQWSS